MPAIYRAGALNEDGAWNLTAGRVFQIWNLARVRYGGSEGTILIRPRLKVPSEDQIKAGLTLLRRPKSVCMISRALTVPQDDGTDGGTREDAGLRAGQVRMRPSNLGCDARPRVPEWGEDEGVIRMFSCRLVRLIESHADRLARTRRESSGEL